MKEKLQVSLWGKVSSSGSALGSGSEILLLLNLDIAPSIPS